MAEGSDKETLRERLREAATAASNRARRAVQDGLNDRSDKARSLEAQARELAEQKVDRSKLPRGLKFIPALSEALGNKEKEVEALRRKAQKVRQECPMRFVKARVRRALIGIILQGLTSEEQADDRVRKAVFMVASSEVKRVAARASANDYESWEKLLTKHATAPYCAALPIAFKRECERRSADRAAVRRLLV